MSIQKKLFCVALLLSLTAFTTVFAGNGGIVKIVSSKLSGTASIPLVVTDTTSVLLPIAYKQAPYTSQQIKNIVRLSVIEETNRYMPDFTASVAVKIEYGHTTSFGSLAAKYVTLAVTYNKEQGVKYNASNYFSFDGWEYVRITIDTITAPLVGSFNPASVLLLEDQMRATLYASLSSTSTDLVPTFTTPTTPPGAHPDEVRVGWTWPSAAGNNGTQLEWAWLENELRPNYTNPDGSLNYALLFKYNATRVDLAIDTAAYNIPLFYDGQGKLYFRIRAVNGHGPAGGRIDAPWSAIDSISFNGHNDSLNWQVTTSYAEEGKRKTVIQYFDGSLRGRQTVTKDNTTNTTISAETFYDQQGRAAIQVLPAPGINNIVAYTQNLNRFNGQGMNEDPSNYFDLTTPGSGNYKVPALNDSSGAAQYYSVLNPEISSDVHDKNLPDAHGFAYTVTRYTPDATGRIMRQSGVGDSLTMASGHEAKYYYGGAAQEELDGLFGTEVGDFTHYFKNMVQDANGQMSVSYVDMHGRTIATALAGAAPATLQALPVSDTSQYHNQAGSSITRNLLDQNTNTLKGNSIEAINTILVPYPTLYDFTYHFPLQTLKVPVCGGDSAVYHCKFDLAISITDESGDTPPIVTSFTNLDSGSVHDTITLPAGSYAIRKTLTINQASLQQYLQQYDSVGVGICQSQQTIIDSIEHVMDSISGCGVTTAALTCQSCLDSLGTYAQYKVRYATSIGIADTSLLTTAQVADIRSQYVRDSSFCKSLNSNISHQLDIIQQQMLADMTPYSGQYAQNPDSAITSHSMYQKYDIFATGGTTPPQPFYQHPLDTLQHASYYYTATGSIDSTILPSALASTPDSVFQQAFVATWANALLPYHPEYNKLRYARDSLGVVYDWIDSFNVVTTPVADPIHTDTYFTTKGVSDSTTMHGYVFSNWQQGLSLWQYAYGNALGCGSLTDTGTRHSCYTSMPSAFTATGNTVSASGLGSVTITADMQSQAWSVFQALYTKVRTDFVNNYINKHSDTSDNQNLVGQGYRVYFPTTPTQQAQQSGWSNWFPTVSGGAPTVNIPDSATAFNGSHCASYIASWQRALLQCPTIDTSAHKDTIISHIINRMLAVCQHGTDAANPFGAASVAPGNAVGTDTSFEQVVFSVLDSFHIAKSQYCNPYVINYPKPHGYNPPFVKNITGAVDTCMCNQFRKVKIDAVNAGADTSSLSSMNVYLQTKYGDTISTALFAGLQHCSELGKPSGAIVSKTFKATGAVTRTTDATNHSTESIAVNPVSLTASAPGTYPVPYKATYFRFDSVANIPANAVVLSASMSLHPSSVSFSSPNFPNPNSVSTQGSSLIFELMRPLFQWNTSSPLSTFSYSRGDTAGNFAANDFNPNLESITAPSQSFTVEVSSVLAHWRTDSIGNTGVYMYAHEPAIEKGGSLDSATYVSISGLSNFLGNNPPELALTYHIPGDTVRAYFLSLPQPLPSFLICGFVPVAQCYSCSAMASLTTQFRSVFAGTPDSIAPVFGNDSLDTVTMSYNVLYANYLNYRTGMQHNWLYYAQQLSAAGCTIGLAGDSGINCATGTGLDTLVVSSRTGNTPALYSARRVIRFTDGFHSGVSDSFSTTVDSTLLACAPLPGGSGDGQLCLDNTPLTDTTGLLAAIPACQAAHNMAVAAGANVYQRMQQQVLATFQSAYLAQCLAVTEQFSVTYTNKEYHYTLYYYDQAGNLVKTVPPKGVYPRFDTAFTNSVERAKLAGTVLVPSHSFYTQYRYNSLNQVMAQRTPDAGTSHFWYDRLGRLVVSQNSKQVVSNQYSYTLYDVIGRISQVGQLTSSMAITDATSKDDGNLQTWLTNADSTKEQITSTIYDIAYDPLTPMLAAQNLRNRVAYSMFYNHYSDSAAFNEASATFYSYDPHGNVDTLLQDYKGISVMAAANKYKRIVYEYDLVSGKVNQVSYQPGQADAFHHRYNYDAENRITSVETSRDSLFWEQDAQYEYYKHGPLARTVLGQQQVQAERYVYTLQGWIKAVNPATIDSADYPVARDIYGYALNYYNNDYAGIGITLPSNAIPSQLGTDNKPLYNGNISSMGVNIVPLGASVLYNYGYDQLNRLVSMDAWQSTNNVWGSLSKTSNYQERVSYDPNGNILKYLRNGTTSNGGQLTMDSLSYSYYAGTNQLNHVNDGVSSSNYTEDIDNQPLGNYRYDSIGNLISDSLAGIRNVLWTVYGKIDSIAKADGSTIKYRYDVAGNRISKIVIGSTGIKNTTVYVRDAQGNVMSLYTASDTVSSGSLVQSEIDLYGSSRLGIVRQLTVAPSIQTLGTGNAILSIFTRGEKLFELSNHLGNVLVTLSDKKIQHSTDGTTVDYYNADVASATDFYPFGMSMPGRSYSNGTYRYGFNGKEKSDEINGNGVDYDYGMRMYDARVGRFLSVDPLQTKYPWNSVYAFAENDVIRSVDLDGLEKVYHYELNEKSGQPVLKKQGGYQDLGPKNIYGFTLTVGNKTYNSYYYTSYKEGLEALNKAATATSLVSREADQHHVKTVEGLNQELDAFNEELKAEVIATREHNPSPEQISNGYLALVGPMMGELYESINSSSGAGKETPNVSVNEQASKVHNGNPGAANANRSTTTETITYEGKEYPVNATTPYKRPTNATTVTQRQAVNQPNSKCATCGTTQGPFVADHKTPLSIEHISTGSVDKTKMRTIEATQSQCESCSVIQSAATRKASMQANKIIKQRQQAQQTSSAQTGQNGN